MKNFQTPGRTEALKVLRNLMFSKSMSENVKRAIRVRLEFLLENEEKSYAHWHEVIKDKLNKTRQKQITREYQKKIQAVKIVIYWLTPYLERTTDIPTFVVKKDKKE